MIIFYLINFILTQHLVDKHSRITVLNENPNEKLNSSYPPYVCMKLENESGSTTRRKICACRIILCNGREEIGTKRVESNFMGYVDTNKSGMKSRRD